MSPGSMRSAGSPASLGFLEFLGSPMSARSGGEPFVLLFETITFESPTGGKEIDVVVNH